MRNSYWVVYLRWIAVDVAFYGYGSWARVWLLQFEHDNSNIRLSSSIMKYHSTIHVRL